MRNMVQLPHSDQLNIASLSRLFDNKSECYKLFWFQAILSYVRKGRDEISFEELIDEMIADAWYMVTEYHLNLGPRDTLEKTVLYIAESSGMIPSVKKSDILEWLMNCRDPRVIEFKRVLTKNVPFRLLEPFLNNFRGTDWNGGINTVAQRINQQKRLIYYFIVSSSLQTKIHITPEWMEYLRDNQEILQGWIQYNMIVYLQRRNPSVPGISDKLYPPQERKLEKVKKYWKLITGITEIHEIYGGNLMTPDSISIDHFVPWSYVAHDELWNLHPTTKSYNSRKSNTLPAWSVYFPGFGRLEYMSYCLKESNDQVKSAFHACAREHLNNPDIQGRLYKPGLSQEEFLNQLEDVVYPVFVSAKNCGFKEQVYSGI